MSLYSKIVSHLFQDSKERKVEKTLRAMQSPVFNAVSVLLEASVPQDATCICSEAYVVCERPITQTT